VNKPTCPHLRACWERLLEADERREALAGRLTESQAQWRPAPGSWSVVDCFTHLTVTAGLYFPNIGKAVTHGRSRAMTGTAPYGRGTLVGRLLLKSVTEQTGRRFKAPRKFHPPSAVGALDAESSELRAANDSLRDLMLDADGLALGRIRLGSPVSRVLRLSLAQVFELQPVHELRHLGQAERVIDAAGFPS